MLRGSLKGPCIIFRYKKKKLFCLICESLYSCRLQWALFYTAIKCAPRLTSGNIYILIYTNMELYGVMLYCLPPSTQNLMFQKLLFSYFLTIQLASFAKYSLKLCSVKWLNLLAMINKIKKKSTIVKAEI